MTNSLEKESHKEFQRKLVHANGYAFAAVLLTVGMTLITWNIWWFVASLPLVWLFGMLSTFVIGGNAVLRREGWND